MHVGREILRASYEQTKWGAASNRAFTSDRTIGRCRPSVRAAAGTTAANSGSFGSTTEERKRWESRTGQTGRDSWEEQAGKRNRNLNDRIFEVLPNYGTVENAKELPPLTSGQKFRLATAGVFDWAAYPFNGVLSAIAQAKNDPKEWGQGWGAYGKRFGASFTDNSIGTYMTTAVFPSLLHEDPRYYQLGNGRFVHRAYHGINRLFVTRTDSGHDHFNYSESVGNAVAAAISNVYHVPTDSTASRTATTFVFLICTTDCPTN